MSNSLQAASNGMSDYSVARFVDQNERTETHYSKVLDAAGKDQGFRKTRMAELEHFPITRGHSRQQRNSFRIPLV